MIACLKILNCSIALPCLLYLLENFNTSIQSDLIMCDNLFRKELFVIIAVSRVQPYTIVAKSSITDVAIYEPCDVSLVKIFTSLVASIKH